FALGYATIYVGFCSNSVFERFRANDYSYGIYIFSFPIQQTMVTFFPTGMTWWANVLLAYPIVLCVAALSWHFIERPSLRYVKERGQRSSLPLSLAVAHDDHVH